MKIEANTAAAAALLLAGIGFVIGLIKGEQFKRIEAVEAGHAEWVVYSDGSTEFKWKTTVECANDVIFNRG
jgi:hypothetical protein